MKANVKPLVDGRYRAMVVLRLLAATLGAYAVASLSGALMAFGLPLLFALTLADGVVIGTMLSFVVHAGLSVLAFSPLSVARVWLLLMAIACLLALLLCAAGGNVL